MQDGYQRYFQVLNMDDKNNLRLINMLNVSCNIKQFKITLA